MARFTWNSVQRKIAENENLTAGLRAKAEGIAEHLEGDGVAPPTVDFPAATVTFVWAKGTNLVKIAVHPKGPLELYVTYRSNDFNLVHDICEALVGF